jgi:signal transduction histidine kinase
MKRSFNPLLRASQPDVRRRLIALAVLGVGLPILFLAGLGILQATQVARFLRETTLEYGNYAATLVANALEDDIERRANSAAESARLAAGWGGASPRFLYLLESDDPLLRDPFLTPVEEVRSRLEGVFSFEPDTLTGREGPGGALGVPPIGIRSEPTMRTRTRYLRGPADSTIVSIAVARHSESELDDRIEFPAWFWRTLIEAHSDTMLVLPANAITAGSPAYVVLPIMGFPQRVVAIAGWRFDPEGIRHKQLHDIVEQEVYLDERVFRGDVMSQSLAILLYNARGKEVFRSREPARVDTKVVRPVGKLLPGWTVVATPSKENAYATIQRFVVGESLLMIVLLLLSLGALVIGLRLAMHEVEVAELKGSFLANVTHELKTPLAMIRMAGETLELGRVRNEEESKRFLATINRETRRLTHLINNVLDFSKIEEGKREFMFAPTDLRKLVRETLDLFEPQIRQGGFEVKLDIPETMPPVEVDAQAVTQCLINLVDNAIKYSRDTKEIGIAMSSNGTARVAVSDRGIGVPPKDRERIFEKFARAETGLVHNVKGSGLGLALVRHIARAHGGDIELKSIPGEGSTFTLVLPVTQNGRREENGWPRRS